MKRILFILALVMSAVTMMAEDVRVTTKDGLVIAGEFIDGTDSTYTIKCSKDIRAYIINKYGTDTLTFQTANISEVAMYGKVFVPHNGKLTAIKPQEQTKKQQPTDPNYVIGKALKSTGGFALGVGIPCMAAGTALMILGYSNITVGKSNAIEQGIIKNRLATAGTILFPIGASLKIIGIPLHSKGKKIMTMNFNYTGNGVGVGLEF